MKQRLGGKFITVGLACAPWLFLEDLLLSLEGTDMPYIRFSCWA